MKTKFQKIGDDALNSCENLISINIPLVTNIGVAAFAGWESLTSANFPSVTTIGEYAFYVCENLTSITLGTNFETETEIEFGINVFGGVETENVDLILGENVLPKPNLTLKIWQNTNYGYNNIDDDYIWKSIKITQ